MFIVEREGSGHIVADDVLDAVSKFNKLFKGGLIAEGANSAHFNVWNTMTTEFSVVRLDKGNCELVFHLDKNQRKKLIEEMMFKAHCDDTVLRQLCELAALQINTQDAYNDWVQLDLPFEEEKNETDS